MVTHYSGTPWGVNLATGLRAISGADLSYFHDHRLKDWQEDRATLTVQSHSDPTKTEDKVVMFSDVPNTYCNPEKGMYVLHLPPSCGADDQLAGIVVNALKQAGWDINNPMGINVTLEAITGIEAVEIFSSKEKTDIDRLTFYDRVFRPTLHSSRTPIIIETDPDKTNGRLNKRFSYATHVSSDTQVYVWEREL